MAKKQITFEMPGDQDWDEDVWSKLGVGCEWERLGRAFYNTGVDVDDTEDIVLEFDEEKEPQVREIVEAARNGNFGPDCQTYWKAAVEVPSEEE